MEAAGVDNSLVVALEGLSRHSLREAALLARDRGPASRRAEVDIGETQRSGQLRKGIPKNLDRGQRAKVEPVGRAQGEGTHHSIAPPRRGHLRRPGGLSSVYDGAFGSQARKCWAERRERLGKTAGPLRGCIEHAIPVQGVVEPVVADHGVWWPGEWIRRPTDAIEEPARCACASWAGSVHPLAMNA